MTITTTRIPTTQRTLGAIAWAVTALGLFKFLGILADAGAAHAPWGFLFVLVLPFAVGALVLRVHQRAGAAVIGLFATALAVLCAIAAVQGIQPYVGDWLLVLVGGPLYLV